MKCDPNIRIHPNIPNEEFGVRNRQRLRFLEVFGSFGCNSGHSGRVGGFTLIEILVALAAVAFLAGAGAFVFSRVNAVKALEGATEKTLSLLNEARQLTLSAKDGAAYGVHFEEHKVVLFKGPTYTAGASSNKEYSFAPSVKISAISLVGGGADTIFKKLTGATEQSVFVRLSLVGDANASSTITIEETGIAYSN